MFWGIKSKRLDRLFPWRVRHVEDCEILWWQRPFLVYCLKKGYWRTVCNHFYYMTLRPKFKSLKYWILKRV